MIAATTQTLCFVKALLKKPGVQPGAEPVDPCRAYPVPHLLAMEYKKDEESWPEYIKLYFSSELVLVEGTNLLGLWTALVAGENTEPTDKNLSYHIQQLSVLPYKTGTEDDNEEG